MVLEFKNVSLKYQHDKFDTISNLSFSVADKEDKIVLLDWQQGKTSIAKLVAGIVAPSSGEILYHGKPLVNSKDNKIAVIFDNYALEEDKAVMHNLEFGMRIRKIDKELRKNYLRQQIQDFSLEDFLETRTKRLGSANKLRVALARAYWREIDLLVLDNALDLPPDEVLGAQSAIDIFIKKHNCAVLRINNKNEDEI